MYKGQFAKWCWTKYNKSGNGSKTAKSRTTGRKRGTPLIRPGGYVSKRGSRQHAASTQLLSIQDSALRFLLLNEDVLEVEATLRAYGAYISAWSEHETPWRAEVSRERWKRGSVLQKVRRALDHFSCSQVGEGGEVLRQAFLQMEDAISEHDDVEAIWDCCLAVPQLVLSSGLTDILLIFTRYLHNLTSIKLPGHPIAAVARRVFRFAQKGESTQLQHYIERGWRLWVDLVGRQRGNQDPITIHLKRGYVMLQAPDPEIIRTLMSDFGGSVERMLRSRGPVQTTSTILEIEALLGRMFVPLFTDVSTRRAEALLQGVLGRLTSDPVNSDLPIHRWSYFDRYLFFSVHHCLAAIADRSGDRARAAYHRRKGLESPKDMFWMQTAMTLESHLRDQGMMDEADDIERERLHLSILPFEDGPAPE